MSFLRNQIFSRLTHWWEVRLRWPALADRTGFGQRQPMGQTPPRPRGERATIVILAVVSMALALMCAGLAYAWKQQRDQAECWRAAAQFQLQPDGECKS